MNYMNTVNAIRTNMLSYLRVFNEERSKDKNMSLMYLSLENDKVKRTINEMRYKASQMRVNLMDLKSKNLVDQSKWEELEKMEEEIIDLLEIDYKRSNTGIKTKYGEYIYDGDSILQTLTVKGEESEEVYGRVSKHGEIFVIDNGWLVVPLTRECALNELYFVNN